MKALWDKLCNKYLAAFCEKHGLDLDDAYWVRSEPGTVAAIGDYFVGIDEMRYDIDNNIEESRFFEWYYYTLDIREIEGEYHMMQNYKEFTNVSFESYCEGFRPYSEQDIEGFKADIRSISEFKRKFEKEIGDFLKKRK